MIRILIYLLYPNDTQTNFDTRGTKLIVVFDIIPPTSNFIPKYVASEGYT